MNIEPNHRSSRGLLLLLCGASLALALAGCSAGKQGLLSITPQQYFYSAKEQFETIDERAYTERDLDEVIRVLTNAEKDAKNSEIMDKSRLYLVLANTLKARKQYETNLLAGKFVSGRAEPLYVLDTQPVKETLRTAKKWLRMCLAQFKTKALLPDLALVEGLYHGQKMLTTFGREREESLWAAVAALRRCLALAPAYKSDFRLFGKFQGPREVRLQLVETLARGGEVSDAWELLTQYDFSPGTPREDLPWLQAKGLVLAMMGHLEAAATTLAAFKIVVPQDYPQVEQALWLLEGVYDALGKARPDEKQWAMEARIVGSMIRDFKGPFSKTKHTTASHLFPRWLPADRDFFAALQAYTDGRYLEAGTRTRQLLEKGLFSSRVRERARVMALEAALFGGETILDTVLEDVLQLAMSQRASPLLRERIGHLLARYLLDQDQTFARGRIEGEHQTFAQCLFAKPWAITLRYERANQPQNRDRRRQRRGVGGATGAGGASGGPGGTGDDEATREPASLVAEVGVNRAEDWVTSASLSVVELPRLALLGKGRLVGREDEGNPLAWRFKGADIDLLRRGGRYLVVFEYSNSDSEPSLQGALFEP